MIRLIYVSQSLVAAERVGVELSDIVAVSRARNAALGVTGALIHAKGYFAQVLEGNRDDIKELMVSIRRDPRHAKMEITEICAITERRFKSWLLLAYHGGSIYIEHTIRSALRGDGPAGAASSLLWLFEELSEAGGIDHDPAREV